MILHLYFNLQGYELKLPSNQAGAGSRGARLSLPHTTVLSTLITKVGHLGAVMWKWTGNTIRGSQPHLANETSSGQTWVVILHLPTNTLELRRQEHCDIVVYWCWCWSESSVRKEFTGVYGIRNKEGGSYGQDKRNPKSNSVHPRLIVLGQVFYNTKMSLNYIHLWQ